MKIKILLERKELCSEEEYEIIRDLVKKIDGANMARSGSVDVYDDYNHRYFVQFHEFPFWMQMSDFMEELTEAHPELFRVDFAFYCDWFKDKAKKVLHSKNCEELIDNLKLLYSYTLGW